MAGLDFELMMRLLVENFMKSKEKCYNCLKENTDKVVCYICKGYTREELESYYKEHQDEYSKIRNDVRL